jgi:hypothetical protein
MRVLAVLVLVVGFLVVWGGFTQPDAPDDVCPRMSETSGYAFEFQWWPPGTIRCVVTDGDAVTSKTTFPWRDYGTVVLFALAVAVFRPRPVRMVVSAALVLAALALFFIGPSP